MDANAPHHDDPRALKASDHATWPWIGLYSAWAHAGRAVRIDDLPIGEPCRYSPVLKRGFDVARLAFIRRFGFPLIVEETVRGIAECGPLLEVGAGTGFLAHLLRQTGADIVATDAFKGEPAFVHGSHDKRLLAMGAVAAVRRHPGRAVVMSWPSHCTPWAANAAREIPIGGILVHIGEGRGGCTGTPALHRMLDRDFEHVRRLPLPRFHGLYDNADILRRVR